MTEVCVAAYLMRVQTLESVHLDERFRGPRWFSAAKTIRQLQKRREKRYVKEMRRVVREAMHRLES